MKKLLPAALAALILLTGCAGTEAWETVSDTLGALLFPTGAYFFPFIFVEMLGSFLFAVSLYRTKITSALRTVERR